VSPASGRTRLATAPSRWTRAFPAAAAVPAGPARRGNKLEILAHTHPAGSTDRFGAELAYVAVVSNAIHLAADTGCVITCPFIPGRLPDDAVAAAPMVPIGSSSAALGSHCTSFGRTVPSGCSTVTTIEMVRQPVERNSATV
jgi:hypothetical protein